MVEVKQKYFTKTERNDAHQKEQGLFCQNKEVKSARRLNDVELKET